MTDEIIDADAEWPATQTGGEDSECDPIVVAGEGLDAVAEDEQDDHELDEFASDG